MMICEHVTQFAGKPVVDYDPSATTPAVSQYHYRLSYEYDDEEQRLLNKFAAFLEQAECEQVTGLVIGMGDWAQDWGGPDEDIVAALVAAQPKLPNLKALFLGDIISEENEISWIIQSDVSPLFLAYPELPHFRVRGNDGLSLGTLEHERLQSLILESGGLSAEVVRQVAKANLPELQHLELWLGEENYGGTARLDDIRPILTGERFPKLTYLGLCDSEFTDDIAEAVVQSSILNRIKVLDLSKGTLSDRGAQALLDCPAVHKLEKLDLHYHFLSDAMMSKFRQSGLTVDLSEAEGDSEDRYPAVTE